MTDISLIFPPQWHPGQPHLALLQLCGYLRDKNIKVEVHDINIEYYNNVLKEDHIRNSGYKIVKRIDELEEKFLLDNNETEELKHLLKWFSFIIPISKNIEKALNIFRKKEEFKDIDSYKWASKIINSALKIISLPFYPECISLDYYHSEDIIEDSHLFIEEVKRENIFSEFLNKWINSKVELLNSKIIGINITDYGQMLPAFVLCSILKKKNFKGIIILGGTYITKLKECLKDIPEMFDFVDMFSFYEGEYSLLDCFLYLDKKLLISEIRNIFWCENKKVIQNKMFSYKDKIFMDISDIKKNNYITPELVIPIQYRRGCAYGKCVFCEHSHITSLNSYRSSKNIDDLIEKIAQLNSKYNINYFYIVDDMITISELKEICEKILLKNLNIKWMCYAMFQKEFYNKENIKLLYKAGLRKLWFGLESASTDILTKMNKKREKGLAENVLRICFKYNISVHLFCIIGFPTENEEQAYETINFIINNKDILDSKTFSLDLFTYSFMRNSIVFKKRKYYNIEPIKINDLQIYFRKYNIKNGIGYEKAKEIVKKGMETIKKEFSNSIFIKNSESQDSYHLIIK